MRTKWIVGFMLFALFSRGSALAQGSQEPLTLEESIKTAMERSLTLHSDTVGVVGSEFRRKEAITNFLPLWAGEYGYTRYSSPFTLGATTGVRTVNIPGGGGIPSMSISVPTTIPVTSRYVYNFSTTLAQPLFTGGLNLANYRLTKLGVDLSKETLETAKRDLVLQVRVGYFNILRAEKFLAVAQQQVKQFEAQLDVTNAFFEVGIVPKNDVLLAEVNLANARQSLVKAENDLATAKASFNIILRREINMAFEVVDILEYKAFPLTYQESLEESLQQRPEIKTAQLNINQAKEGVKVARSGFSPMVSLLGNYNRISDDINLSGGEKFGDNWTIQALATFTLWNWGNTAFKVGENKVKVTQAEDAKAQLIDSITLEVRDDYLFMQVAEKNIRVAQVAIAQAEENVRMNEERYKYQVATQTDVVNAVTLLAQAQVNYYGALSDFNVAKAQLERAMGRMYP
jgi:outer membrane protein